MASKTSKNQRVVKASGRPDNGGERTYITPLNKGLHAYVSVDGKIRHVETSSEKFDTAIRDLGEANAPKVVAELERLSERFPEHGWDATLARLRSSGVV